MADGYVLPPGAGRRISGAGMTLKVQLPTALSDRMAGASAPRLGQRHAAMAGSRRAIRAQLPPAVRPR